MGGFHGQKDAKRMEDQGNPTKHAGGQGNRVNNARENSTLDEISFGRMKMMVNKAKECLEGIALRD